MATLQDWRDEYQQQGPAPRDKDSKIFPLPERAMRIGDAQTWVVHLPPQYNIADVLDPMLWSKIELQVRTRSVKPQVHDYVRILSHNGDFDAVFTIESVQPGYVLRFSHGRLSEGGVQEVA